MSMLKHARKKGVEVCEDEDQRKKGFRYVKIRIKGKNKKKYMKGSLNEVIGYYVTILRARLMYCQFVEHDA